MTEPSAETMDAVRRMVMGHATEVDLLTDYLMAPAKREALMVVLVAAYGEGFESGLRKGGKAMADALIARATA